MGAMSTVSVWGGGLCSEALDSDVGSVHMIMCLLRGHALLPTFPICGLNAINNRCFRLVPALAGGNGDPLSAIPLCRLTLATEAKTKAFNALTEASPHTWVCPCTALHGLSSALANGAVNA